MYSMMEDNSVTIRSKKFKKLTKAICGLVSFIVINCIVWKLSKYTENILKYVYTAKNNNAM